MLIEIRNLTWTVMHFFLAGVFCDTWKVVYHQQHICAVSGSSVVIPCSYYYPGHLTVIKLTWLHVKPHQTKHRLISGKSANKFTRFQDISDKHHNCSFKIEQVEYNDEGKYIFRFLTNSKEGKWTGRDGLTLKVADLKVSVTKSYGNRTMKEGDSVNLTCINACDGNNLSSAFTWFKNGEPISEGRVLYLSNMTFTSSGNYTCSLKTHTGKTSGAVNINVEYGPKNTSVSVKEVNASGNPTLICSSRANPPVENYTWFKVHNDDIMDTGAEFFPSDGGQYLCRATNKHGSQNSSIVTLKMKSYLTFPRVLIIATVAALLIVITIITAVRLHKKRTPEAESQGDTEDADYVNWLTLNNNQSQEENQHEEEAAEVIYTTVYFNNKRKSSMEQQMESHTDDQSVLYSTVCRNQLLNPSSYIEPS